MRRDIKRSCACSQRKRLKKCRPQSAHGPTSRHEALQGHALASCSPTLLIANSLNRRAGNQEACLLPTSSRVDIYALIGLKFKSGPTRSPRSLMLAELQLGISYLKEFPARMPGFPIWEDRPSVALLNTWQEPLSSTIWRTQRIYRLCRNAIPTSLNAIGS